MIRGIGTDLIELERIKKACQKEAFLTRVYTQAELRQAMRSVSKPAGDFAVKEAVSKTLGTGFFDFMPKDIEVLRDRMGKPYVNLYGNAKKRFEELHLKHIEVTITNTKEYALAVAVGEGDE